MKSYNPLWNMTRQQAKEIAQSMPFLQVVLDNKASAVNYSELLYNYPDDMLVCKPNSIERATIPDYLSSMHHILESYGILSKVPIKVQSKLVNNRHKFKDELLELYRWLCKVEYQKHAYLEIVKLKKAEKELVNKQHKTIVLKEINKLFKLMK